MSPLKARVFDLIRRAGSGGISARDIHRIAFADRRASLMTVRAHVWQINEAIAETGYRIEGRGGGFRLRRTAGSKQHGAILLGVARA